MAFWHQCSSIGFSALVEVMLIWGCVVQKAGKFLTEKAASSTFIYLESEMFMSL